MIDGARQKTLAKKYGISEAQVSALRKELELSLDQLDTSRNLFKSPISDVAIAIDETFLKIEGASIYVIMGMGYYSHKVLGL